MLRERLELLGLGCVTSPSAVQKNLPEIMPGMHFEPFELIGLWEDVESSMKITTLLFTLSPEQFRAVAFKSYLRLHLIIALVYLIIGAVIVMANEAVKWNQICLVMAVTFPFYGLVFAFSATLPRNLMKLNSSIFLRKRMMEFDEEGFTTRFDSGSHAYTVWPDVEMVVYRSGITNFYLTKMYIVQVPDSAFPSARERDQLHALLRTKNLLK